jgi:pyruvate/2-oxoglutarate dehydrogenase complex dihydrolipoamide acyltransferase (E2) component
MPEEVLVPKWGASMTEATVVRWHKAVGDTVEAGEPLVDLETDKIEATVDAPAAGVLTEVHAQEDDVLPVGGLLAIVEAG